MTLTGNKAKAKFVAKEKVRLRNGKPGWRVAFLENDNLTGDKFFSASYLKVRPGMIYSIEIDASSSDDNLTVYGKTVSFLEPWPDEQERLLWEARAQEFDLLASADRREKKEGNFIRQAMAPLSEVYWQSNWQGQAALELLVLRALRTRVWP